MILESPPRPFPSITDFVADLTVHQVGLAVVAFLFAASGPVAIMLTVGTEGGMSTAEMSSWIFGAFYLNGAISLFMCLRYRQPLVFLWTIPGVVLVGQALTHLSFAEVVGAYFLCGLLMLVLGLSGWVRRCMEAVPMAIVMGMVAGVFLKFGLDWIKAVVDDWPIALPMTLAFFAVAAVPALARRLPPLIASIIVGALAIAWLDRAPDVGAVGFTMAAPLFTMPVFSWQAVVELVIPLTITVIVVQNGQGIVVLRAAGHKTPINAVTATCGVATMLVATAGAVPTCLTGPLSGIIASGGTDRRGHYAAAVLVALGALLFGAFAPVFTGVMLATPPAFIATLGGIALLKVLQGAFATAFRDRFALGALVAFMVTVSDVTLFNIGAPFWGLVLGFAASWLLERGDLAAARSEA